jgi:hypothetical protein
MSAVCCLLSDIYLDSDSLYVFFYKTLHKTLHYTRHYMTQDIT